LTNLETVEQRPFSESRNKNS